MNSSTDNINSYDTHPYEGAVHSSDILLSSTGPSFQNSLKGNGCRKQHLGMENEFRKDLIFPTSYSEIPQSKSNFTGTPSHEVLSNKPMSTSDSSSMNKNMMSLYGNSDDATSKTVTCTSNSYESEETKSRSRIRDATSNKECSIPTDSYRFDSSRCNFEKPQEEEKNPTLPRNPPIASMKDNQKDNLHQVWGSDFKPTQHSRNDGLECPFDMEKASSNPKLPINSLSSEMGVRFDMNTYNNWKIQDRVKARTSKGNNFLFTSMTGSNSIAKDEYFEDSYGPLFLDQNVEKSNVAFSQHFHHQSTMSFHEGEYESRVDPSCDLMRRGHHDIKIATTAYDNASSMVTTTTATFPNYRSHYYANDLLPSTQSIPIAYGPSHFEPGYGVMSLSAFNEMYKTTTTNTHFQPLRFNDILSSDTSESRPHINSTSTEGFGGEASSPIENFDHVRAPSLTDGSSYSSQIQLNPLSPRHMYPTANNTIMDREDMLNQKIYPSFSSSLPTPPPLIKSPIPVSTNSCLDHSNINLNISDNNKSNNKSQVETELLDFRSSSRSFERQDAGSHIFMNGPKEDASTEKMNGNINSFYNAFNLSPTPNRLEPVLFSYPNELSPDSTTKNVCRICGKTYARPSTLKTHMRTHSGERPYKCFDCNKSFSQAANLTAHCRTHSGEKPFHCGICNRTFSQSSSVTTHMRTHSGERPYRCKFCKKAFSDSSTLTKHLRIHSGEKPYQCKLCKLKFSQSGNLNRHMRIHEELHDGNLQNMTERSNSPILNMSNSSSQDMFPMTIQHDNYLSYNNFDPNCSEADKQ